MKPVVGSSPTASAWENARRCFPKTHVSGVTAARLIPNQFVRVQILGDVLQKSPVVQRLRHLSYKQKTMVRFHPGLLSQNGKKQISPRCAKGRAARLKPERLQVRLLLWVLVSTLANT